MRTTSTDFLGVSLPSRGRALRVGLLAALLIALSVGCGGGGSDGGGGAPPEVGVVTVQAEPYALKTELPGRLEASRVAEVRARVAGIVLERVYREGSYVEEGDVLFRIDPAPLQAAYDSARAALARAEANLVQARLRAQRYAPLVETNAISKQDYDDAVAARTQAEADVSVARAALRTAQLNLDYATVRAPISGRIGRAMVTEGALVGQGSATLLTTIHQIDPMYVDITQPSRDLTRTRRALEAGRLSPGGGEVTVVTEDGHPHPLPGKLLFTDVAVDRTTAALVVRAEVPNPDGSLLPGMYVRAQLQQATLQDALLIPQQSLIRDGSGATVRVVGEDGVVEVRSVEVGPADGQRWVILSGLQPGERIVVEGLQKARPGGTVTPAPWEPAREQRSL